MHRFLIVCCLGIATLANSAGTKKEIPDYVPICKRTNPDLSECYRKSANVVLSHMGPGIPEMNLRQGEPLQLDAFSLAYGTPNAPLNFDVRLDDIKLFGIPRISNTKMHIDLDALNFKQELLLDKCTMTSNFNGKGKILLLQFDGKGSFKADLTDLNITGVWTGERYEKKGQVYGNLTTAELILGIGNIQVHFDNLFPTEELNTQTNKVINENMDVFFEEFKPLVVGVMKTFISESVNNVYSLFPLDVLFPE